MHPSDVKKGLRTWIDIDTSKLKANVDAFRALIKPSVKLMGVVKSNAYGHGLVGISELVTKYGADWIGVDSIVEGIKLREEGITAPILILGYTLPEMIAVAADNNISITASHVATLKAIASENISNKVKVHIKVDTGMHRQGFDEIEKDNLLELLKTLKDKIEIEGLFTHFASAKNPSFADYTKKQIKSFELWRTAFKDAGYTPIAHASATAGTILFPEAHYDMVRVGIGLYGLWPSKEVEAFASNKLTLQPILTWKTLIGETKNVSRGEKIGYDGTEMLSRDSVIAICPIGYWHGYPRALSSVGEVLVNNKKAKILGRISMDMIIIDITDCDEVTIGAEVVLIGTQGKAEISAERVAYLADASWYELVTRINPLIRKHYL